MLTKTTQKTTSQHPKNKILEKGFKKSQNFYQSDEILQHYLQKYCSPKGYLYMEDKWMLLGERAATQMDRLSILADKNGPVLNKRNALGEDINEIEFHPAYEKLTKIAVDSEMFRVKWLPENKEQFKDERHSLGFASGFLYAMVEGGLFCPLCMTDGVARILDLYASEDDKARLLPHIFTDQVEELYTGAMFLTEKAGGSDVGANLVSATHYEGDYYLLNGEKWFCSNANAELILALARTNPDVKGTKGLSIFLIEKIGPDGKLNHKNIVRLKDKIGVRSMASAEIILEDTIGKIIGKEGEGFKIMTDMINLSRVYNSVTASACIRRVLVEAYQYLSYRKTFGKTALDHSLVRDKMAELAVVHQTNFYLTWRTIEALNAADQGDEQAMHLVRILTPLLKKETAIDAVYASREAMEAIGGLAYIEENIIPKILRDALVLPIWEGAGNIMVLDMLRATFKSEGLQLLFTEMHQIFKANKQDDLLNKMQELVSFVEEIKTMTPDEMQLNAKYFFEALANLYKTALLYRYQDETSKDWIKPAIQYLKNSKLSNGLNKRFVLERDEIERMIAWIF